MSELPERKVLKDILPKLKLKAMNSENRFEQSATNTMSSLAKDINDVKQQIDKAKSGKEKALLVVFLALANSMYSTTNMLIMTARTVVEDLKIYIDSLEKYSMELDKAFWGAIEKEVEKQRKQQEELRKKEPTYRA